MKKTIKANAQLIDYYRYLDTHSQNPACVCTPTIGKSFSSQTNYANISNSQRIANILASSLGGRIQFGNGNGEFVLSNNSNNFVNLGIGLGPRNKF